MRVLVILNYLLKLNFKVCLCILDQFVAVYKKKDFTTLKFHRYLFLETKGDDKISLNIYANNCIRFYQKILKKIMVKKL